MQRYRQIDGKPQGFHLFDAGQDAAGGNGHIAVTDVGNIRLVQKLQGAEYRIKIQHRLTAAHDHDTADPVILRTQLRLEHIHLCSDFSHRQVPHRPIQSAGTEGTVHIAANLTGDTDAVSVIMMHQHRFYRIPVRQLQQYLGGQAVCGIQFTYYMYFRRQYRKFFL